LSCSTTIEETMVKDGVLFQTRSQPGYSRIRYLSAFLVLFIFISVLYHISTAGDLFRRTPTLPAFSSGEDPQGTARYNCPGQIRKCKAPRPNSWSGLSERETAGVLDLVEKSKSSVGLGPDDIVYGCYIYKIRNIR
jgi:hypothetical protein